MTLASSLVALLLLSSSADTLSAVESKTNGAGNRLFAQQTVHDVAVFSVHASHGSVSRGAVINVDVTIQNLGTSDESFLVVLRDETDAKNIISMSLGFSAGQTLTLGIPWDTSLGSIGLHSISARVDLPGDQVLGNNSAVTATPIEVVPSDIVLGDGTGLELPDASFGKLLTAISVPTDKQPAVGMFIGGHDATFGQKQVRAGINTVGGQYPGVYIANADATFAPSGNLQNPFKQGQIQGLVHLEGLPSSVGAYIQVGQKQHFVNSDGSFQVAVPSGTYDLVIQAPGYVPVRIPQTQINSGDLLTIPELTLPFGDANGDGKIDILDLSIAAANFGTTIRDVPPP